MSRTKDALMKAWYAPHLLTDAERDFTAGITPLVDQIEAPMDPPEPDEPPAVLDRQVSDADRKLSDPDMLDAARDFIW